MRSSKGFVGYDLFSAEEMWGKPYRCELIKMDISIKISKHKYGRTVSSSGLAFKKFINVGGVIDSNYKRGSWCVTFHSFS